MSDSLVLAALAKVVAGVRERLDSLVTSVAGLSERVETVSKEQGPAGKDGRDGTDGVDGKDGRDGTDGVDGKDGRDGTDGVDGKDGRDGTDGTPGAMGPMPKHQWRGTELRFQRTPDKWGAWVDLRGPSGRGGTTVVGVTSEGGSNWNPDALGEATDDLPEQFVVRQEGQWVRASYMQMQLWFPGTGGGSCPPFDVDGGHADTEYEGTFKVDFGGAQ